MIPAETVGPTKTAARGSPRQRWCSSRLALLESKPMSPNTNALRGPGHPVTDIKCYNTHGLSLVQVNTNPDNLLVGAVLVTPARHVLKHCEHKHKLPMHQNTKTYELHLSPMYPNTNNCVLHIRLMVLNTNNLRRSGN